MVMTFKEMYAFLKNLEEKNMTKHPGGTYVCANLSRQSKDALGKWVEENNIPSPADPKQYHTTITYSRKGIPTVTDHKFDLPIKGKIIKWKIFPAQDNKKCLVAVVDSPDLEHYHTEIQTQYGAQYDYPDYIPHITVSYDYPSNSVPKILPALDITYVKIKIEPLDIDYTSVKED